MKQNMKKIIRLNERDLRNIIKESINILLTENENNQQFFDDTNNIINSKIEEIKKVGRDSFEVLFWNGDATLYVVLVDVYRKEISPSFSGRWDGDIYEAPYDEEYQNDITIKSILCYRDYYSDEEEIIEKVDVKKLTDWLERNVNWDELYNN